MKKRKLIAIASLLTLLFLAGCNKKTTPTTASSNITTTEVSSSALDSSNPVEKESNTFAVSLQDAITVYQEAYPDSDITSISLDSSLGKWFYQIDGVNDTTEFELEINAENKEVKAEREEALDKEDANGVKREADKLNLDKLVPIDEITAIAEKTVEAGTATDWELEKEVGTTFWNVTVKDGNQETEVKIDAQTKDVLETELDD